MKLRVLGCAGAEFPNFHPSAFLIDDSLMLDAGTIGAVLSEEEQWAIKYIFVTHAHLDHIRDIPLLADNIVIKKLRNNVKIAGIKEVLEAISSHLLNNVIWPDFNKIPTIESPIITYRQIEPEKEIRIDGYSITAIRVDHSVPAVGYLVRKNGKSILYTGDTGPTDRIWEWADDLSALIVEVSFPNDMEETALLTRHLTSSLLDEELKKIKKLPPRILVTHPKPQYYAKIAAELRELGIAQIELLKDGAVYDF